MKQSLQADIKKLIIDSLGLEDISVEDIDDQTTLFGADGLGLDSVDALELGLAIQKKYQLQLDSNSEDIKQYFKNVATLADYIKSQTGV